jgi:hypothetical protein
MSRDPGQKHTHWALHLQQNDLFYKYALLRYKKNNKLDFIHQLPIYHLYYYLHME